MSRRETTTAAPRVLLLYEGEGDLPRLPEHLGELESYLQKAVPGVRSLAVAEDDDLAACEE